MVRKRGVAAVILAAVASFAGGCTFVCNKGEVECRDDAIFVCEAILVEDRDENGVLLVDDYGSPLYRESDEYEWVKLDECLYGCFNAGRCKDITETDWFCPENNTISCRPDGKGIDVCINNRWEPDGDCPSYYVCDENAIECVCDPAIGTMCDGNTVLTCGSDGIWNESETCGAFDMCRNGECVCNPSKGDICSAESTHLMTCREGRWQIKETCGDRMICNNNACVCDPTVGDYCNDTVPMTCSGGKWTAKPACGDTYVCKNGSCVCDENLGNLCGSDQSSQLQCINGAWKSYQCTNTLPICDNGRCVCEDGNKMCGRQGEPMLCVDGQWQSQTACGNAMACDNGECKSVYELPCTGSASSVCADENNLWECINKSWVKTPCADGCADNACIVKPVCPDSCASCLNDICYDDACSKDSFEGICSDNKSVVCSDGVSSIIDCRYGCSADGKSCLDTSCKAENYTDTCDSGIYTSCSADGKIIETSGCTCLSFAELKQASGDSLVLCSEIGLAECKTAGEDISYCEAIAASDGKDASAQMVAGKCFAASNGKNYIMQTKSSVCASNACKEDGSSCAEAGPTM